MAERFSSCRGMNATAATVPLRVDERDHVLSAVIPGPVAAMRALISSATISGKSSGVKCLPFSIGCAPDHASGPVERAQVVLDCAGVGIVEGLDLPHEGGGTVMSLVCGQCVAKASSACSAVT